MQIAKRTSFAVACLSFLAIAACGGGVTSPSSSEGSGAGMGGSTIVGTVKASSAASSSASITAGAMGATAPASGMVVTVTGTNLSASVDVFGRFELTGVPSGTVQLQFKDGAQSATVQISNVGTEDLIQIQVAFNGASATIVSEERSTGKVKLCHRTESGTYHEIDISVAAELTHRAHGDAKVGEPVPADTTMIFNASCEPVSATARAEVRIQKLTNGQEADAAPGPRIEVGSPVLWEYVVRNTGTVELTGLSVTDDRGVTVTCPKATLAVGESMTCTGVGTATLGQYSNVGTVTASSSVGPATDSDASHYLGVEEDEDGPKVQLCHRTGNGSYHLIEVSVSAEAAHRAHGDAKIGEAVPGQAGKVFLSGCRVQ